MFCLAKRKLIFLKRYIDVFRKFLDSMVRQAPYRSQHSLICYIQPLHMSFCFISVTKDILALLLRLFSMLKVRANLIHVICPPKMYFRSLIVSNKREVWQDWVVFLSYFIRSILFYVCVWIENIHFPSFASPSLTDAL